MISASFLRSRNSRFRERGQKELMMPLCGRLVAEFFAGSRLVPGGAAAAFRP